MRVLGSVCACSPLLLAALALLLLPAPPSQADLIDIGDRISFTAEESSLLDLLASLIGISGSEISAILSLARVGLGMVEALETIFVKVFNGTSLDFDFLKTPGADKQLLNMYEIITLRLEQIENGVEGTESSLRDLARGLPYLVRYEIAIDTLEEYTRPINSLFHRFAYYQKHKMQVEDHTIIDFAESVVSHSTTSIMALMANIHSMVAPSDPPLLRAVKKFDKDEYEIHNRVTAEMSNTYRRLVSSNSGNAKYTRNTERKLQEMSVRPSIFNMLEDAMENYNTCQYKQSPQNIIYGLYTLLTLTFARGYSMITFSYNILKFHNEGNFTIERQLTDELYQHYTQGLYKNSFHVLSRVSNSFKRCDPAKHIENETFVMATELLQGYIENEVDLNSRGSCGQKCSNYKHAKSVGCYLPDKQYCGKHRRCKGNVHDCKFFHADATVCISEKPYRRYDWITYEDQQRLGRQGTCNNLMKVDSWWRFLYHCSYCICLCDDQYSPTSDRYISLRPVVSDVAEGMIVTGIKFTKVKGVIHMQVQQGKAMAQGQVNHETLRWVKVDPIAVGTKKYVENVDYFTMMYEARNIDLDHLKAPKRHVVTGVKFRMLGSHVNMEMWVTPINFTTGEMTPTMSYWISNDNTPVMTKNPREELTLNDVDDPRKSKSESLVDSRSDMFVTLQPTSLQADVAQLTVPFFDAQPVAPNPSSWLEGVQMYHRGRSGFGGFIGFRIFNYNLTYHFREM